MKVLEVLSARLPLIVLNCLCLAVVLPMSYAVAMFAGPVAFALLLAPLSGLAAFIGRVRRKPLLLVAAGANLLLLAAAIPVLHGLAGERIPFSGFALASLALFVAPLLSATACWLRWPRLHLETSVGPSSTRQPGAQ